MKQNGCLRVTLGSVLLHPGEDALSGAVSGVEGAPGGKSTSGKTDRVRNDGVHPDSHKHASPWLATRESASVSGTIESVRRDGAPAGAKTVLKRTLGVLSRRGQTLRSDEVEKKRHTGALRVTLGFGFLHPGEDASSGSVSDGEGAPGGKSTSEKTDRVQKCAVQRDPHGDPPPRQTPGEGASDSGAVESVGAVELPSEQRRS